MSWEDAAELAERQREAQAVAWLDGHGRFAELGLGRIERLLDALGRPDAAVAAYHVAGTNGKGSVCAHLASILGAAGVASGLYTSPHLQTASERIVVDGRRIAGADLERAAEAVRDACARAGGEPPTAFEAWTAAALWHFARARVGVAAVEVGLGGRGDATSAIRRGLVSVVTTIHRDHIRHLGSTLAAIAGEKAGIFRPGRPALVGRLPASALAVVADRAHALGIPLYRLGEAVRLRPAVADDAGRWRFDLELAVGGRRERLEGLASGLAGRHQAVNAALAVAALRIGEDAGGPRVDEAAIRRGLAAVRWPARLERVDDVLIDGAHNLEGARALAAHLRERGLGAVWVLGGLVDRPPGDLLDPVLALAREAVAVAAPNPRARSVAAWQRAAARRGRAVFGAQDVGEAIAWARARRRAGEVALVAGSLYLAGGARDALGLAPPWPRALPLA